MITQSGKIRITAVAVIVIVAVFYILFFTRWGISFQHVVAHRVGYGPYLRLVSYRIAARYDPEDPGALNIAANNFRKLAFDDLQTARQMVDRAIQLHPDVAVYYSTRGSINMMSYRYAEARADFEKGLRCWRDGVFDLPSQELLSNALIEATGCHEAHERAWGKPNR
jgi:hypothetical protein